MDMLNAESPITVGIAEQAIRVERLMPDILRRMFTLGNDATISEMPLSQLRICSYLQDGPRSMSEVSAELRMSCSAVTQIADRMERSGLVERVPALDDRRLKHLHLTERAKVAMEARRERRTRRVQEALALLPDGTREDLLYALEQLWQATLLTDAPLEIESSDPDSDTI